MNYVNLGRTGLKVSRLCLGTMNFGPETIEADSVTIMDMALDSGINFFDTADVYGWKKGEGVTERIVGRWLARDLHRDRIVLATKCYGEMGDGPNDRGLSALHIRRACEASLRRLQTDHIDLYQMHHVERDTPWDEIWQAIEQLVREGKVLYAGSSNFAAWNIAMANETATRRHGLGLVCEQSKYNLTTRSIELEVIPACHAYGLGVIAWSPLEGGILGGALKPGQARRRQSERGRHRIDELRPQLEAWEALCHSMGESPADVALAWILSNPRVTGPIIGPRTQEQLTSALKATTITLNGETLAKIDAIWPGPGGEAPMAYAW
jgi:aryl-alcohol dehydrogenase-like predicted oxidoreductase